MSPHTTIHTVRHITRMAKALGDPHRIRALMALRGGELCACALIALLRLAPSTVSKHLQVLEDAGVITARKSGRWVHYRLAGRTAPPHVRAITRAVCTALAADAAILQDATRLTRIRTTTTGACATCYRKQP